MTRALLIDEPPLLVLPSLVHEVGLPAGILLQQIHFAGRRQVDGWVERTVGDWHRALRRCISARTIERALAALREAGWVEYEPNPGAATRYRVAPAKLAYVSADLAGEGPPNPGGAVSREETTERKKRTTSSKKRIKLADEVVGFTEWMGYHVTTAATFGISLSVPAPETLSRTELHKRFAELAGEGRELAEMKLASLGVLSSVWHRENGHVKLITVLRQGEKLQERIDAGRAAEAAVADGSDVRSKYAFLDG